MRGACAAPAAGAQHAGHADPLQGVPMLQAGDEFGRTQRGNNNAYCQDNEISWVDWRLCAENQDLVEFVRVLTKVRRAMRNCVARRFSRE